MFAASSVQSLRLLHAVHFSVGLLFVCALLPQLAVATALIRTVVSGSGSGEILFLVKSLSDPRCALFSREVCASSGFVVPAWAWLGKAGARSGHC